MPPLLLVAHYAKFTKEFVIHNPDFIKTFKKIAYNSITIEYFEMAWKDMLTDFDLVDNEWLHSMYGIRQICVPTYLRDIFFGGMSTTSKSESINAFLKQYVTQKNGLYEYDNSARFSCDGSLLERHGDLSYDAAVVVDEVSMCKTAYQHAKKVLQELKKSIREINEKEVMEKDDSKRRDKGICHEERYLVPKNAKTKGHPKILKFSREKAMRKPQLCRGCGGRDISHDMRNYPMLIRSPMDHVSRNNGSILEDKDEDLIECEASERGIFNIGTLAQI